MTKKLNISEDDLLAIEKKLTKLRQKEIKAYTFYHKNPIKLLFIDLVEGIFKGIGFVIGGTLIISIIALLLTKYFSALPIVGDYFNQAGEILQTQSSIEKVDLGN